jgi:hypothetical protein
MRASPYENLILIDPCDTRKSRADTGVSFPFDLCSPNPFAYVPAQGRDGIARKTCDPFFTVGSVKPFKGFTALDCWAT